MNENDYQILFDENVTQLESEARKLLRSGWLPLGGVAVSIDNGVAVFAQAFVSWGVLTNVMEKYAAEPGLIQTEGRNGL